MWCFPDRISIGTFRRSLFFDHFLVTSITEENESFGMTGENSIRKTNSSWGSKLRTSWPFSALDKPCWAGNDKWFRGWIYNYTCDLTKCSITFSMNKTIVESCGFSILISLIVVDPALPKISTCSVAASINVEYMTISLSIKYDFSSEQPGVKSEWNRSELTRWLRMNSIFCQSDFFCKSRFG